MKARVNGPCVRVAVAALAILLGAAAADWIASSPTLGQEEGGDPVPNEETRAGCQSHSRCNMHCDTLPPACPPEYEGVKTCSQKEPACAKCKCTQIPGNPITCECK